MSSVRILQLIEDQFGITKETMLRAFKIRSVGHEHINDMSLNGAANVDVFAEDIVPLLPNSRFAVFFGITFSTEPNISWITKKGGTSKTTRPLSTVTLVTTGLFQFDVVVSNKLKYNMQDTLDYTFENVLVVEYAIGL